MTSENLLNFVRTTNSLAAGFFVLLGLAALFLPGLDPTFIKVTAWLWIASGLIRGISYFSQDQYQLAFQNDLVLGAFMILLGILLLVHPQPFWLPLICGVLIAVDGLFKMQVAVDARVFGIERWWAIALAALLAAGLAVSLLFVPALNKALLAAALISEGVMNVLVLIMAVRSVKGQWKRGIL